MGPQNPPKASGNPRAIQTGGAQGMLMRENSTGSNNTNDGDDKNKATTCNCTRSLPGSRCFSHRGSLNPYQKPFIYLISHRGKLRFTRVTCSRPQLERGSGRMEPKTPRPSSATGELQKSSDSSSWYFGPAPSQPAASVAQRDSHKFQECSPFCSEGFSLPEEHCGKRLQKVY